jgi:glucan phosphoethanolaminetransferase (alkaline phosphatase superfamily)
MNAGKLRLLSTKPTHTNAILITVDTLRADHTTPYGYARETTPQLAAFAKDAVVFETAVAQASWTRSPASSRCDGSPHDRQRTRA